MKRFLDSAVIVLAVLVAIAAYLLHRFLTCPRKGPLRRVLLGTVGGLLLWAIYATCAWQVISTT